MGMIGHAHQYWRSTCRKVGYLSACKISASFLPSLLRYWLDPSLLPLVIATWRIFQSDWRGAFWSLIWENRILPEKGFAQWNINNNMIDRFRSLPGKTYDKMFQKMQNHCFWPILGRNRILLKILFLPAFFNYWVSFKQHWFQADVRPSKHNLQDSLQTGYPKRFTLRKLSSFE